MRIPKAGMMRRRRVWIAASLILIGGVAAAVASMATSGGPGSTGGGPGVHGLLSQVQSNFGDGRLVSYSISRRTLTVKVSAPDEPSAVSATFEAQMLAAALRDERAADAVGVRGRRRRGKLVIRMRTSSGEHLEQRQPDGGLQRVRQHLCRPGELLATEPGDRGDLPAQHLGVLVKVHDVIMTP